VADTQAESEEGGGGAVNRRQPKQLQDFWELQNKSDAPGSHALRRVFLFSVLPLRSRVRFVEVPAKFVCG
jgi:hypothetical protein